VPDGNVVVAPNQPDTTSGEAGDATTKVAVVADVGPSESPDASATTPVVAAETIQLEIRVEPSAALISIDGIDVEGNPFTDRFPRDGARHRVEAKARGYAPHGQFVVFDRDRELTIELQARRRPGKRPGKRPGGSLERDNPYGLERANPYGS